MRILVVHNHYQQPGGEDVVYDAESRLLEERGHDVLRYTAHNDEVKQLSRWQVLRETVWNGPRAAEVRQLIRSFQPDIMHVHNTFMRISPAIYWAAADCGVPVVQTIHNYRLVCPNALLLRDGRACEACVGKQIAWPSVVHGCYRGSRIASAAVTGMVAAHRWWDTWNSRVTRYIAVTEFARRMLVAGGIEPERIVVKPNMLHPDPGPGTGSGSYCLFVGRLSREKGIDVLLAAWNRVGRQLGLTLKIVGDGPEAVGVREAAKHDDSIAWLGFQPPGEVRRLMGEAAFLVFPSICYEGMPMTILEALARGTPVIATNHGAMPSLVEPGRTGLLFPPGDPEALPARLVEMAGGHAARAAMRRAARGEFLAHYTAEQNYTALMAIYRHCLESTPAAAAVQPAHA